MRPTIALGSSPELFAPISESRRCQISQRTKKIYKKTMEALVRLLCSGAKALPLAARPYIASSPSSPLLHLLDRLRDIVLQLHYNGGPGQWDFPPYSHRPRLPTAISVGGFRKFKNSTHKMATSVWYPTQTTSGYASEKHIAYHMLSDFTQHTTFLTQHMIVL